MADRASAPARSYRWLQLVIGIICMTMIANLQYGWTLFVTPMDDKYHWGRAGIQIAFSIFVLCETWLVPVEGWFVDRFGPKIVVLVGGILVGIAWVLNGMAESLTMLYVASRRRLVRSSGNHRATAGTALLVSLRLGRGAKRHRPHDDGTGDWRAAR